MHLRITDKGLNHLEALEDLASTSPPELAYFMAIEGALLEAVNAYGRIGEGTSESPGEFLDEYSSVTINFEGGKSYPVDKRIVKGLVRKMLRSGYVERVER